MSQNIYDDPEFLAGYRQLDRSRFGLDGAPEWPTIRSMLPPVDGLRVLDLGCGFGWFCRWAAEHGAASVVGVDVSTSMLEQAEADTSSPAVEYRLRDLEALEPGALGQFDLVYSSLALHYVPDLPKLLAFVGDALSSGGHFVFSVEHPIFSAPSSPAFRDDDDGSRFWPLNDYMLEGTRTTNWFADGVVKHHRTVATHVNALVDAGFALDRMAEFGPDEELIAADRRWIDERHRPMFLIFAAAVRRSAPL